MLLQSTLGLEFDLDRNEILLRDPQLPSFLEQVTLKNLRIGAIQRRHRVASGRHDGVAAGPAQRRAGQGRDRAFAGRVMSADNAATGGLFYDSDGTGAVAAIQLATLSKNLALTFTSFDAIA